MTNFIYNMQDELFHLNMILPVGEFSPIKKLVDHIEAQGKQLRELNNTIAKKNETIEKCEREKESLRNANNCLFKKVSELKEGIRDSEDLTWKQKYDALLQSSEQAIGALQKKCQEYKNAELEKENKAIKEVRCPWGDNAEIISAKTARIKELEEKNKKLERANLDMGDTIGWYVEEFKKLKEDLEKEKQVSKGLNVIINSKNKLLDEYMTKCNNLEHNYNEEVRMKEQFKRTCFKHEETIKKLKRDNDILRGKVNEIGNLAESILMLCDDEE